MLHWWVIPAFVVLVLLVWGFYLGLKVRGGDGVRSQGRTLVDKPEDNPSSDLPPD